MSSDYLYSCIKSSWDLTKHYLSFTKPIVNLASKNLQSPPVNKTPMEITRFTHSRWVKIAAITGATSVILGAYGAHGFKNKQKWPIFETANKYNFYHSLALLAAPFSRKPNLVGGLFLGGIIIFCGTCYYHAMTGNDFVIQFTPIGGFMFILGWLCFLL